MNVRQLIESLQAIDEETPVILQSCLNTPNGQVLFGEELDTVVRPLDYGKYAGYAVLCNWNGPAVHLADLTPIN
jgi:hypothetical protein